MAKIVVGMSGGVDSAVSALLLKREGHEVIGLFMKNWEEVNEHGICCSAQDYDDVRRICEQIAIPHYALNFTEDYWRLVFTEFLSQLKLGYTPNPDIWCNRDIKFSLFFKKAMSLGSDFLATGHYARTEEGALWKGIDPTKDQSYFLYTLPRETLKKVLFPVGHLAKSQVRDIARRENLAVHNKKDSTGICFIGKRKFKSFISRYIPQQKGPFETVDGRVIGTHDGAAYYTIGQRKGLGIGGSGEAWFVVRKDMKRNAVILAQGEHHPSLYASKLLAKEACWNQRIPLVGEKISAKIRYRQEEQPCTIESIQENELIVSFQTPQRAITPRQAIVFYKEELCLGGALIESGLK